MQQPQPSKENGHHRHHHAALCRGVLVNVVGLLAKLAGPALVLVVTHLFGPAITGVFLLAQLIADIARNAAVSGYYDAVTIFGSRALGSAAAARGDDSGVYRVLASVLRFTLFASVGVAVAAFVGAEPLSHLFPQQHDLAVAIRYGALSLPLLALGQAATAATKIRVRMEYDVALWSFGKPFGLLGAAVLTYLLGGQLRELMLGYFLVHVALAIAAAFAFARLFDWKRTLRACLRGESEPGLHRFALPQNINTTFGRYQSRIDVLALGMLGYTSELIAFYVTGALLAACLQEVRMVFSTALAPVIARYHRIHDRNALEHMLARVSRWTTTLVVPATALVLIWRSHLLLLVDKSYTHPSGFLALLLLSTLIQSSIGLAGNYLVFMGHSGWNLFNSLAAAALNTALSLVLIPHFGLAGAALANCVAALVLAGAQLLEVRYLEGIRMLLGEVYKPYVGAAVLIGLAVVAWDPAKLGGPLTLACASVAMLVAYAATLLLLGHEELTAYLRLRAQPTPLPEPRIIGHDGVPGPERSMTDRLHVADRV
jgi:O-antigen/teichoic acid export membrane protein